jgi:hypothetical protein
MPWELGSGNKSDYDFHITNAFFAPDANYQGGESTLLHLEGYDEENEECSEMYNVGKDWISPDGGDTVTSTKNAKKINRTSMYGHFITKAFETNDQLPYLLEKKGDANEAKVWIGLVFHMEEVEISFGRGINPVFRNMPTRYIGDESGLGQGTLPASNETAAESPKPPANPSPAPSAAERIAAAKAGAQPSTPLIEAPSTNGVVSINTQQLSDIAKASDTFEAFVNSAVEIPGVSEDDELLNLVLDPTEKGLYFLSRSS